MLSDFVALLCEHGNKTDWFWIELKRKKEDKFRFIQCWNKILEKLRIVGWEEEEKKILDRTEDGKTNTQGALRIYWKYRNSNLIENTTQRRRKHKEKINL
jgi:hypothetical protein